MKKIFAILASTLILFSSCSKETTEDDLVIKEITSAEDISHSQAAELLRHCVREEYGGAFHMMKLYHNLVRVDGVPCDSTFNVQLADENTDVFTLKYELEMQTICHPEPNAWNRLYLSSYKVGTHLTRSEGMDLEMNIIDEQSILGNFEQDVYSYSHTVQREIAITKGIAAELEPEASVYIFFNHALYDSESIEMSPMAEGDFKVRIRTNETSIHDDNYEYQGTISMIDDKWTISFNDGVVAEL